MIDLFKKSEERQYASQLKNPFVLSKIESVYISIGKGLFSEEVKFKAVVEFVNGSTSGEQKIEGSSFADLINKLESFIQSL